MIIFISGISHEYFLFQVLVIIDLLLVCTQTAPGHKPKSLAKKAKRRRDKQKKREWKRRNWQERHGSVGGQGKSGMVVSMLWCDFILAAVCVDPCCSVVSFLLQCAFILVAVCVVLLLCVHSVVCVFSSVSRCVLKPTGLVALPAGAGVHARQLCFADACRSAASLIGTFTNTNLSASCRGRHHPGLAMVLNI